MKCRTWPYILLAALLNLTGLLGAAIAIWIFVKVVKHLAFGVTI